MPNTIVSPVLEASTEIDAPVARVWAIVADLKSMGERSPQCHRSFPLGPIRTGTFLVNINHEGRSWWPTTARITRCEPQREIGFRMIENRAEWVYTLEPLDDGMRTRLVERRLAPNNTTGLSRFLVDKAMGGNDRFEARLVRGMERTLAAVKAAAESRTVA